MNVFAESRGIDRAQLSFVPQPHDEVLLFGVLGFVEGMPRLDLMMMWGKNL